MKKYSDLPIYFIIIGLVLNITLSLYTKTSFIVLLHRSIVVIILFGIMGYIIAEVLRSAAKDISKVKNSVMSFEAEEQEGKASASSTIDIRTKAGDDDELIRAIYQPENDEDALEDNMEQNSEDFVEINPENFERFMNQE